MRLPKACLFDLDGVIVDTVAAHFKAWKTIADELGIHFSEKENEQLKGVSRIESMKRILDLGGREKKEEEIVDWTERKNKIYVSIISQMTPEDILPGVIDFLNLVESNGIDIAIGSSSKNAPTILNAVGLSERFKVIVDGNCIAESKPHPEVFLKGAEALGHAPEECIVLEDAQSGVEAAHRAKMKCIGVGEVDVLNKADLVVKDLTELDLSSLRKLG